MRALIASIFFLLLSACSIPSNEDAVPKDAIYNIETDADWAAYFTNNWQRLTSSSLITKNLKAFAYMCVEDNSQTIHRNLNMLFIHYVESQESLQENFTCPQESTSQRVIRGSIQGISVADVEFVEVSINNQKQTVYPSSSDFEIPFISAKEVEVFGVSYSSDKYQPEDIFYDRFTEDEMPDNLIIDFEKSKPTTQHQVSYNDIQPNDYFDVDVWLQTDLNSVVVHALSKHEIENKVVVSYNALPNFEYRIVAQLLTSNLIDNRTEIILEEPQDVELSFPMSMGSVSAYTSQDTAGLLWRPVSQVANYQIILAQIYDDRENLVRISLHHDHINYYRDYAWFTTPDMSFLAGWEKEWTIDINQTVFWRISAIEKEKNMTFSSSQNGRFLANTTLNFSE